MLLHDTVVRIDVYVTECCDALREFFKIDGIQSVVTGCGVFDFLLCQGAYVCHFHALSQIGVPPIPTEAIEGADNEITRGKRIWIERGGKLIGHVGDSGVISTVLSDEFQHQLRHEIFGLKGGFGMLYSHHARHQQRIHGKEAVEFPKLQWLSIRQP